MRRKGIIKAQVIIIIIIVIAAAIAGIAYILFSISAPVKKELRIGAPVPGTAYYIIGSLIADTMKSLFPEYGISFYAIGGATANTKEFISGGLEITFGTASDMLLLYRRELWYKDIPPNVIKPVHTLYMSTALHIIATTQELKERYRLNSWKDLDGKKACYYSSKYENYHWTTKALDALGIRWIHVEMDWDLVSDALKKGDIVAATIPVNSGIPPPWCIGLITKLKNVVMIPPSPDEVSVIEKMGGSYGWFPTEPFKKAGIDVAGMDKVYGVILCIGWHTTPEYMSEDDVYKLLKELIRKKDDLAKVMAYLQEFASDPIGLQVTGISLAPEIPVHPGLAKLLKEYNAWNPAWKIASK